ncbi:MAG: hypothetical protein AAF902_01005 [Chloroflexota bacterium]
MKLKNKCVRIFFTFLLALTISISVMGSAQTVSAGNTPTSGCSCSGG